MGAIPLTPTGTPRSTESVARRAQLEDELHTVHAEIVTEVSRLMEIPCGLETIQSIRRADPDVPTYIAEQLNVTQMLGVLNNSLPESARDNLRSYQGAVDTVRRRLETAMEAARILANSVETGDRQVQQFKDFLFRAVQRLERICTERQNAVVTHEVSRVHRLMQVEVQASEANVSRLTAENEQLSSALELARAQEADDTSGPRRQQEAARIQQLSEANMRLEAERTQTSQALEVAQRRARDEETTAQQAQLRLMQEHVQHDGALRDELREAQSRGHFADSDNGWSAR